MMIYEIRDELKRIDPEKIDPEVLTVGCVTCDELAKYGKSWGFCISSGKRKSGFEEVNGGAFYAE